MIQVTNTIPSDDDFINALSPHRKKLYWRSIRRGMKESDLILGGFARHHLHNLTDSEVNEFEAILSLFDADFLNYITAKSPVPADLNTPIFHAIKSFKPYA
ncbi:MAG: antitoxin CptB [Alphaproteobacteria bacterium]|jgi:antitoxin CptB